MKFSEWLALKENDTQLAGDTHLEPQQMMAADAARRIGADMTAFVRALRQLKRMPVNPNSMVTAEDINAVAKSLGMQGMYSGPGKGNNKWVG